MIATQNRITFLVFLLSLSSVYANYCEKYTENKTVYIANPTLCASYVVCNGGKVIREGKCQTGFSFDSTTGSCLPTAQVTCPTGDNVGICNGKENKETVPDPNSCQHYYYCLNDAGFPGDCGKDYIYNTIIKNCEYFPDYDCSSAAQTICDEHVPGTILPSDTSCHNYIFCSALGPMEGTCGENFYYNPETIECDYPENVDCSIEGGGVGSSTSSSTAAPQGPNAAKICGTDNEKFVKDPTLCTNYYYCYKVGDEQKVAELACPDGRYFDEEKELCVDPEAISCTMNPCFDKPEGYFAPDPYDCQNFYYCGEDPAEPIKDKCPDGYQFDPENQNCNYATVLKCQPTLTTVAPTSGDSVSVESGGGERIHKN